LIASRVSPRRHLYKASNSRLQKTRDLLVERGREEDAKLAQIEMDALNFDLQDGDLGSMFSGVDKGGQAREYPSIEMFGDERGTYIERRLSPLCQEPNILSFLPDLHMSCGKALGRSVSGNRQ